MRTSSVRLLTDTTMGDSNMDYERSITLDLPYADAVVKVKAALSEQGFGVFRSVERDRRAGHAG